MSESRPAVAQNPPRVVVPAGTTAGTAVREAGLPGKGSDAIVVVKDAEGHLRGEDKLPPTPTPFEVTQPLVERGRYLARAGHCAGCHTVRGGADYAGGLGIGTPFGTIYSSNLTPDEHYGIGSEFRGAA